MRRVRSQDPHSGHLARRLNHLSELPRVSLTLEGALEAHMITHPELAFTVAVGFSTQ